MALNTYADLQTEVANYLHRSDLTSYIPDFITLAETKIFRRLRTKDMEAAFSSTMATTGTLALPSSYIDLKYAYINTSPVQWLTRLQARRIYEKFPNRISDRKPAFIAREGSNFIFGPFPDSQYLVTGVYYKNVGPLSSSAHALWTSNPDCYLFGSLLEAEPFMKEDPRITVWNEKYQEAILGAQHQSEEEEASGSDLRVISDSYAPNFRW